jgi:DNA-binding NarL/FixJ family response regulator
MIDTLSNTRTTPAMPTAPSTIRALVLDDNQFDRAKIRRLFRTSGLNFDLDEADSLNSFTGMMDTENFDVILMDYNLPQGNGIEALQIAQQCKKNQNAAKILITGDDRSNIAVTAIKLGCQDYISKTNLSAEQLKSSVQSAILESERATANEQNLLRKSDELTRQVMSKYSQILQPEIANIVRDMRRLKQTMSNPNSNLPGDLEAIERKCIGLWSILTDAEMAISISDANPQSRPC